MAGESPKDVEEGGVRKIVECVPNFSEGRRREIVDRIVKDMQQVPGAQVLDVQSDVDHNRSVVTLVGEPQPLVEAAFRGIARAAESIDMNHHRGGHPRMGATDVVPFVPVRGASMEDCVLLARQLGQRVGDALGIPVYLYEEAASRPDRRNLADVRRGEYEGLRREIGIDPERAPDFGPAVIGPAGATAIGARPPLIAFNVYLNASDLAPAQAIARAVRHSSGGLRYVKALGLVVDGQAQVSMNLTDYRQTPVHRVVEMIRSEAAHRGLVITRSEVVGLLPAEALLDAARFYLHLDTFGAEQVLENRLSGGDDLPAP
jgi:glutamate formiminotransferase